MPTCPAYPISQGSFIMRAAFGKYFRRSIAYFLRHDSANDSTDKAVYNHKSTRQMNASVPNIKPRYSTLFTTGSNQTAKTARNQANPAESSQTVAYLRGYAACWPPRISYPGNTICPDLPVSAYLWTYIRYSLHACNISHPFLLGLASRPT